jgi:hypothetical protein
MTRSPLILSLATLALAACSPDAANHPLAPSAPSLAVGGHGAAAAARRAAELPFRGTLKARETAQRASNSLLVHLVGTGTATHLGRYTLVSDFTVALATSTSAGRVTLTAANGDILTATVTGVGVATAGISTIVETATITGGTGRFAGATGSFIIERALTQATGISSGSFTGTISFRK